MESNVKEDEIHEEVVEYKVYKEKPYLNSDRNPFGVTLNGKTKEYIVAHEEIKGLIKKGKQYIIEDDKINILDVTNNKAILIAIVEVSLGSGAKGNVELKVYAPSVNKKKGATIDLRKMSGFDYNFVDKFKEIVTTLLDGLIAGNDVENVIKNAKNSSLLAAHVNTRIRPAPSSH